MRIMADESNKIKGNSQTKKTLYDLVKQIPIIGMPTYNLLKRKGGTMEKLGAFGLIMLALVLAYFVWPHFEHADQQITSNNKTATTDGNNSPATSQSATQSGSNNTLIQAAPGAIVSYGISEETYKQIRDEMIAVQKQKDAELKTQFDVGYILFTVTERNEWVPSNSPMDNIIKITYNSDCKIIFDKDTITMQLPDIEFHPPNSGSINFKKGPIIRLPRIESFQYGLALSGNYELIIKIISTKGNSIIIALGVHTLTDDEKLLLKEKEKSK